MDEVVVDPAITIKAIGHQWYRTYEYSDYNSSDEQSLTFDSYTIPEDDLELGQSRLLEVDNRVVVPAKTHLRIIVTPADVPHSWAVPSLGVKCDAVPGRLNQISISVQREGVYYGQCSEICGTNHAFTPIVVEAVPSKDYGSRVSNQLIPQTTCKITGNTTIAAIITNAHFEKAQLCKIAGMGHDGFARSINPVHTTADGDSIYAVSVGEVSADQDLVGALGAQVLSEAIVRAVTAAESAYGLPCAFSIS